MVLSWSCFNPMSFDSSLLVKGGRILQFFKREEEAFGLGDIHYSLLVSATPVTPILSTCISPQTRFVASISPHSPFITVHLSDSFHIVDLVLLFVIKARIHHASLPRFSSHSSHSYFLAPFYITRRSSCTSLCRCSRPSESLRRSSVFFSSSISGLLFYFSYCSFFSNLDNSSGCSS